MVCASSLPKVSKERGGGETWLNQFKKQSSCGLITYPPRNPTNVMILPSAESPRLVESSFRRRNVTI